MAGNLLDANEAAKLLGVTPDELNAMRSRGEIYGTRTGVDWKFKTQEIERVIEERGASPSAGSAKPSSALPFEDDLDDLISVSDMNDSGDASDSDDGLDAESILVSEERDGHSGTGASSTIIGKNKGIEPGGDSDIELGVGSDINIGASDSDVELVADSSGSDVRLVASGSDAVSVGSDVFSGSDVKGGGAGDTGKLVTSSSGVELDDDSLAMSSGDSLSLGEDDLVMEAESASVIGGASSDINLSAEDDDDDLVLGGSAIGSDLGLSAGDSGINLSPSDSGLSLEEEPLELGGSSVESSLELPEDDDIISLADESADPEAATQLKADDQFLLTGMDDAGDDESSGSQVIALEDSEAFDENANTLLGAAVGEQALVADDTDMFGAPAGGFQAAPLGGATPQPMAAPGAAAMMQYTPETPYSIWNVLALLFIFLFLGVTAILMMDMMRNMWAFDGTSATSTALLDALLKAFKLEP
jgi:hypothetical protein